MENNMNISKLSIDNHQFTIMAVILLVVFGIQSMIQMPKSEDPVASKPGASIFVIYPGATPTDIEQLIVDPIEDTLNELDDIKRIESTSNDGLAVLQIEFTPGSDPDEKFSDINEKVNTVRSKLPNDIYALETMKWSVTDTNFIQFALIPRDKKNIDYRELEKQADILEKTLKKINGIKKAESWAFPKQEVQVELNLSKMAKLKIPINRVLGAIQSSNLNIPGGTLEAGIKQFSVQTSGSYESIEQIEKTVVNSDGTKVVYLKDIAFIFMDYEEANYLARFNSSPCVFVTANQKENTNIFSIMKEIKNNVDEYKKKLPSNLQLAVVYDQSKSVDDRLTDFFWNLLQGIILVGVVILMGIDFRGALIVMTAIPASIFIAIGFVYLSGYGLQQISITGLVIALGMLVDNAIVVVANIDRFIRKGESNYNAAVKGSSQITWAIIASTVTTLLAFIPLVMMRDVAGDFMRSMPLTVIFTLTISLLIALTFTPYLSRVLLRDTSTQKPSKAMKLLEYFIANYYRKWLDFALRKPRRIIAIAILVFFASLALMPFVGVSFFPKAEKKQFMIDISLPEGSRFHETDRIIGEVEKKLQSISEVKLFAANIGRSNPRIYYNIIEKRPQDNIGQLYIELKPEVEMKQMGKLIQTLRTNFEKYPGARIDVKELEQGPPVNAPIEFKIRGEKIDMLQKITGEIEDIFHQTRGLINITNPISTSKTDLQVEINRDKAAMYGISIADIDRTVRMSIAGIAISKYRDKDGEEYNITARTGEGKNPTLDIFDKIYITDIRGTLIPLSQLAQIKLKRSPTKISHFNLERSVTLTADVLPGYSVNKLTAQLIKRLDNYPMPPGYSVYIGGEKRSQDESFGGMGSAVIIALLAVFAVLVLQFKSFSQPLIIYSAVPLAIIGSIIALLITGNTFSFTAFIGLTSLVGIVVNNSIFLVDYANQMRKEGMSLIDAVKESGETRFLPIMLTTLTTVGGLLPLALRGGTLWAPMGWTIIGGLLTSTFLTLLVVPVLYKMYTKEEVNQN